MSDELISTVSTAVPSPVQQSGANGPTPAATSGVPLASAVLDVEHEEVEDLALDREHQARLSAVESYDTPEGKKAAAEIEAGRTTEEEQELGGERKSLGHDTHVNAIARSSWFSHQIGIRRGSRLAWILDCCFWLATWTTVFLIVLRTYQKSAGAPPTWVYPCGVIGVLVASYVCARGSKGYGQFLATTKFTNPDNTDESISRQMRIAATSAVAAGLLTVATFLLFFFGSGSSWVSYLGSILGFGANLTLGLAAGVGFNVTELFDKVRRRDTIDCLIDMKRRLRRRLRQFMACVLLALVLSGHADAAGSMWVWLLDATDSLDPDQRRTAIEQLIATAPDRARMLGVDRIQIVVFTDKGVLSDMTYVPVPSFEDCRRAEPEQEFVKGIIGLSPTWHASRQDRAESSCRLREENERDRFMRELRSAAAVTPQANVRTLIMPLLQEILRRPWSRAVDLVSDGIDHSGIPPSSLRIPNDVPVMLILARPNPSRATPSLADVLNSARTWAAVPGLTVITTSEYLGVYAGPRDVDLLSTARNLGGR